MFNRLATLIVILLMASCQFGDENDTDRIPDTIDSAASHAVPPDQVDEANRAIWIYSFDEGAQQFKAKKQRDLNQDSLSIDFLVRLINRNWKDKVEIRYNRRSGDTVFIDIPNSVILTQQMGTQGALEFMVSTTFTLTELKGIRNVSYQFEEGDHAVPGVYNRHSWDLLP